MTVQFWVKYADKDWIEYSYIGTEAALTFLIERMLRDSALTIAEVAYESHRPC
jgi:hypothetical protein